MIDIGLDAHRPGFLGSSLHVGGNANNGANDGRLYGNWNNTAGNANWNISVVPLFRHLAIQCRRVIATPLGENYASASVTARLGNGLVGRGKVAVCEILRLDRPSGERGM